MRKFFDRIELAQYRDASILLELLQPRRLLDRLLRRLTASESGEGVRGGRAAG